MDYFAVITLKAVESSGTDKTIYASTNGGHRNPGGGVVYFPPILHMESDLMIGFDREDAPLQTPARLSIALDNGNGELSQFLRSGSSPQFWDGMTVTIYDGYGSGDGDATSGMTTVFTGYIRRSSVIYPLSRKVIEFDIEDVRALADKPIVSESFSDHAQYDSSTAASGVDGRMIPVIIGDWTGTDARIPAYRVKTSGTDYTYAVCNHEIGSVTVYVTDTDGNETNETSNATVTAATGYFVLDTSSVAGWQDSWKVTVTCTGYPTAVTDGNSARVIEYILTTFGGASGKIYEPVSGSSTGARGSFRQFYEETDTTSPEYDARAYVSLETETALAVAARIAFESNAKLTVIDDKYRLYWELPEAPQTATQIQPARVDLDSPPTIEQDPDQIFRNVERVRYDYDPSTSTYNGFYTSEDIAAGSIIEDARAQHGTDIVYPLAYRYVYDASAVSRSVQRRMIYRVKGVEHTTATFNSSTTSDNSFALALNEDYSCDWDELSGFTYKVLSLRKSLESGQVQVTGRNLWDLPTAGIWLDASGNDAAGNPIESIWADANGDDASGNPVNSVWI